MTEATPEKSIAPLWRRILREVGITLVLIVVIIGVIRMWQSRNLLEDDGSVDAPDITLVALDGTKTELASLKGKRVLLHFWATW